MKLVKAEEAKPGQRVARDVTDLRGNLLFKAGTELNAELIATCRQRNVSHLFVVDEGPAPQSSAADLEFRREQLSREVDRMFAGHDRTPLMASLREAAKRFHLARLEGK